MIGRGPGSTRCGARLTWAVEGDGTAVAYLARCSRCGTLHAASSLPARTATQNWCACSLPAPLPPAPGPTRS